MKLIPLAAIKLLLLLLGTLVLARNFLLSLGRFLFIRLLCLCCFFVRSLFAAFTLIIYANIPSCLFLLDLVGDSLFAPFLLLD